jgi:flavin reductase (DIM6/NTAB) family NADH-FMN oxidoreductase RutF
VDTDSRAELVSLPTEAPIWKHVFLVAPLVLVGTKEPDGGYDLAPKHMAMPLGWENRYCFVCTPRHATYGNAKREGAFTVSFPRPDQVLQTGLAAGGRAPGGGKPALTALPTFPATAVDGVLVSGCALFLECELERVVDGFDDASLIVGRVVAARADPAMVREPERDDGELVHDSPHLAYLSPGRVAAVADSYSFPFPADLHL